MISSVSFVFSVVLINCSMLCVSVLEMWLCIRISVVKVV